MKGANNIFSGGQGFQFEKSSEMMIEDLKKPALKKQSSNKNKTSLNIKQDEQGMLQPDLLLSVKPLRKL